MTDKKSSVSEENKKAKAEDKKMIRDKIIICLAMGLPWALITVAMFIVGYPIFAIPSGVITIAVILFALYIYIKYKLTEDK